MANLAGAVVSADPTRVESALSALASSRRILAPLGWTLGTIMLLFQGLRTVIVNWRFTLIELVPAIWIGLTWWDLRVHALHKLALSPVHGVALVVVAVGVIAITVACYWCNAVFAMAVEPGAQRSLGDAVYVGVQVYTKGPGYNAPSGNISDTDLVLPDGSIELLIGGPAPGDEGAWLALGDDDYLVMVRLYHDAPELEPPSF